MKLAIFGATGRSGIPLVQQALDAGHEVVALVRSPEKMPITHDRLTLVKGDATQAADVERVITGDVDAVLSVLGPVKGQPPEMLPQATGHILAAMQHTGVRRLISMTGAGVSAPQDRPNLMNHLIKFALKTMAADVLKQSESAVDKVRSSDRDWVIVRVPMLTDGPATGQLRVGWVGVNTGARLVRADGAAFMLQQLSDDRYLRQAPAISS